jgi:hypothetical protein
MNISINRFKSWMTAHPKAREWIWFSILWCGSLSAAIVLTLPVKLLTHWLRTK